MRTVPRSVASLEFVPRLRVTMESLTVSKLVLMVVGTFVQKLATSVITVCQVQIARAACVQLL
jgi:hypothetical protein